MNNQPVNPNKVLLLVYKVSADEAELLLLKTTPEPWLDSVWYAVTGGVEKGENIEEAARRELSEETSMEDVKKILTKPVYYEYDDQRSKTKAIEP